MKAKDILNLFREEADDTVQTYLFKDEILLRYLDQAQKEAARRARILIESVNTDVCQYPVVIGKPMITLHPSVISVTHAQFESPNPEDSTQILVNVLKRKHKKDMDDSRIGWRTHDGEIVDYVTDVQTGALLLYRIPSIAGKLVIECARMPLRTICKPEDCLEISDRYADDLVYWMLHRAYNKRDSETFDEKASERNLALFERVFGPPSSAIDEQWHGNLPELRSHRATKFY